MTLRVISEISGEAKHSEPGWKYREVYRLVEEGGIKCLEKYDEIDIQKEINSHAESVDFTGIINSYMNGDLDALERARAIYADVSSLPKNLSEIMAINSRGKDVFEQLPREVKDLFDGNYYEFLKNPMIIEQWYADNNRHYEPEKKDETEKEAENNDN